MTSNHNDRPVNTPRHPVGRSGPCDTPDRTPGAEPEAHEARAARDLRESDPAARAADRLFRLVMVFRGQMQRFSLDEGLEVNPMELKALLHIAHHPGCTASDLARRSDRDKAQITRLLQALEARGWVVRQPDAEDRRVQRLHPTEAGEQLHRRLHAAREAQAQALLNTLDAAEQAQLTTLLDKLLSAAPPPLSGRHGKR